MAERFGKPYNPKLCWACQARRAKRAGHCEGFISVGLAHPNRRIRRAWRAVLAGDLSAGYQPPPPPKPWGQHVFTYQQLLAVAEPD